MDILDKKILVTGGRGFLGSWVVDALKERGVAEKNISTPSSKELDLTKWENCVKAVAGQDIVIHIAARVGGIGANKAHPGAFFYDNAVMGVQLMEAARQAGIKKFVTIGTVCAYPENPPIPFREEDLWEGYPTPVTAPYGLAKKMLLVQGQAYREEYGFNAIFLLPTNLYGPRDDFNPEHSHVIPARIKATLEAQENSAPSIEVWGTGKATRDFLYVGDAAKAIVQATELYDKPDPVNIGSGREVPIRELVEMIVKIVGYQGKLVWDTSKPDGQPRRSLDVSRARKEFGFNPTTNFEQGLQATINWYRAHRT